ncbi:MAG: hypothetical protein ACXVCS_07350, partial [Bdellovibrionota bacterium]
SRVALNQRVAVAANTFKNVSRDGLVLDDGSTRDVVYRSEWSSPVSSLLTLEGAAQARWTHPRGLLCGRGN